MTSTKNFSSETCPFRYARRWNLRCGIVSIISLRQCRHNACHPFSAHFSSPTSLTNRLDFGGRLNALFGILRAGGVPLLVKSYSESTMANKSCSTIIGLLHMTKCYGFHIGRYACVVCMFCHGSNRMRLMTISCIAVGLLYTCTAMDDDPPPAAIATGGKQSFDFSLSLPGL